MFSLKKKLILYFEADIYILIPVVEFMLEYTI